MSKMPSIVFESKGIVFSIPSFNVQSIIKLPEITPLPNAKETIRGLIKYRDALYTVIDFRILTSENSLVAEHSIFKKMLNQREQDHVNWLIELEKSVLENRPFKLATDPHKCAFGKWYDNYSSDNLTINKILHKFDDPHKKIHNIAKEIESSKKRGKIIECEGIIERTRTNELTKMKSLFQKLKTDSAMEFRESAILLNINTKKIALAIEKVISVDSIRKHDTPNLDKINALKLDNNLVRGLGETEENKMIVMISDDLIDT